MPELPDARKALRVVSLKVLTGANYWSRLPVTRLDLAIGPFDRISSADVPGLTERLVEALPGLHEHRCSVGTPGGFVLRLRRGTYAPHIVEHVALEVQSAIGHRVGFGRARRGERIGEYTVVFEHLHGGVGERSALLAVDLVRAVFTGARVDVPAALRTLRRVSEHPDPWPAARQHVTCGLIGGGGPGALPAAIATGAGITEGQVVWVSPTRLLDSGLPYSSSDAAAIVDLVPGADLPSPYRDPARLRRLYLTVAEAVPAGGSIVIPAGDDELQRMAREMGLKVIRAETENRRLPASGRRGSPGVASKRPPPGEADLLVPTEVPDTTLAALITARLQKDRS